MSILVLPFSYLGWHYTLAWRDLFGLYRNFLWFIYHFFSLPVLAKTLFAPWKRLGEAYPAHFNLGATLATFFINSFMRLIGFLMRFILLVFGFLILLATALIGVIAFFVWLVLPLIIILALILGVRLLFHA